MRTFLHTDLTDHTLVRSVALTVFEHESHELNEYFIAHGSHGSADFLAYGLLLLWNL